MQNNNINDSFDSPEFKSLLDTYENMVRSNKSVYFETEELIQIAEYYSARNNPEASSQAIQYALKLHPGDDDLTIYQVQIKAANGKYEEAFNLLGRIPNQEDREVQFTRATLYLNMDDEPTARKLLEKIAFEEDYTAEVLTDIGNVYLDENKYEEAYEWLKKAYDKDPDYKDLKSSLISYYIHKKEYNKVILILNNMIEDDPYNIDLWLDLTSIYITAGDFDKAGEAIDFALAIDKNHAIALETKAYICLMKNQSKKSIALLEDMVKRNLIGPNTIQILAQSYVQSDHFSEALKYSGMMMEKKDIPDYEMAVYVAIHAYSNMMLENYEDCRKDIAWGLELDDQYPNLYTVKGELALIEEEVNQAKTDFAYAELYATEPAETKNQIAMSFFRQGYMHDAIQAFEEIEEDYPEQMKRNYYFMAYAYFFSNSDLQKTQKALLKGAYYTPMFTELAKPLETSENEDDRVFYHMAVEAKNLVDNTAFRPDEPSDLM